MVLQKYQNFTEMTSNMIYIVALGVAFKCPRKIHLNTQSPPLLSNKGSAPLSQFSTLIHVQCTHFMQKNVFAPGVASIFTYILKCWKVKRRYVSTIRMRSYNIHISIHICRVRAVGRSKNPGGGSTYLLTQ